MMSKMLIIFLAVFFRDTLTIETSREMEGYPAGYTSDCPGSTKPARITNASLHHLYFIHLGNGTALKAHRAIFSYHRMKQLAEKMDFSRKTFLFMNGYTDSSNPGFISPVMGSVYTKLGYNVLLLEYAKFNNMQYPRAARLLRPVGRRTAEMLAELTKYGLNPKKLEIADISHGGQGISFIGKNYRVITGMNISRITALDPSGPCFRRLGPEDRIDASDADLVDIIHTNNEGYGIAGAVGHVNIYVNGGEYQVSMFENIPCGSFCSHSMVYLLWIAANQFPDNFIAVKCDTVQDARDRTCFEGPLVTNFLGPRSDVNIPGIFHLTTRNYYPFFLGERGSRKDYDWNLKLWASLNKEEVLVV